MVPSDQRGIIFDVGHGAGSFSFPVAEACLEQGLGPGTVSSDVHRYNVRGPVFDLMTTLSKYVHLGYSIDDRKLKRAGLDYWDEVDISQVENLEAFLDASHPVFFWRLPFLFVLVKIKTYF